MRAKNKKNRGSILFQKMSNKITKVTGSPKAFITALVVVIIWAVTGPVFGYSDTWQLVINTGTTIITFLMVFIIQQSQNKDTTAIQLKLNELIASDERASNRLVDIEDLTEEDLAKIKKFYIKLADLAEKENDVSSSHSLNEAENVHNYKKLSKTEGKRATGKSHA
ncbi:low affinity iron permease family protein [Niastella caeni]|uniref:Low affinity iron permease family protein n=1 Tax=Niastella caeni TaxID=2569763 RepID=A0A4S8HPE0_9BACT|nr:low affinity iron permease family protein [Niastella caeni]THU37125.1 low affinity iron permease family protein [Niastella caeni]